MGMSCTSQSESEETEENILKKVRIQDFITRD